jgi:regulator of replication initiation timing
VSDSIIELLVREIEKLRTVPMKYRRMEFNAQLQAENVRLQVENEQLKAELSRYSRVKKPRGQTRATRATT